MVHNISGENARASTTVYKDAKTGNNVHTKQNSHRTSILSDAGPSHGESRQEDICDVSFELGG